MSQPEAADRPFHGSVENRGDSRFYARTRDASFVLDAGGHTAHPIDAFMACLSASVGHHILRWLQDRNIGNPGFKVSASANLTDDPEHPRLWAISIVADTSRIAMDSAAQREAEQYVDRCPLFRTIGVGSSITLSMNAKAETAG